MLINAAIFAQNGAAIVPRGPHANQVRRVRLVAPGDDADDRDFEMLTLDPN